MLALTQSVGTALRASLGGLATPLGSLAALGLRGAATEAGATPPAKPVVEKEFLVYRWNPDSAEPPKYDSYKVDINA